MHLFWKLNIKQTKQSEKKVPDPTDFVKKTKLTELETKIPDASNLVKKRDYNTKLNKLEKET